MYALLVVNDVMQIADCLHGTGNNGQHVGPRPFKTHLNVLVSRQATVMHAYFPFKAI